MKWENWNKLTLKQQQEYNYKFSTPLTFKVIQSTLVYFTLICVGFGVFIFAFTIAIYLMHTTGTYDTIELSRSFNAWWIWLKIIFYFINGAVLINIIFYVFKGVQKIIWLKKNLKN